MDFFQQAETWVAIAFLIFVGILVYAGTHRKAAAALDARSARIKAELDEASRLRREAESILEDSERRLQDAGFRVATIVRDARIEGEHLVAEAKARADEFVARRTKQAEIRIAQAEAQAAAEVRALIAETAVAAARAVLVQSLRGPVAAQVIARDIEIVKARIHRDASSG